MTKDKIKLKFKSEDYQELAQNLNTLNFNYLKISSKNEFVIINFLSQYQVERLLNISELKNYTIQTYVEDFAQNQNKILFDLIFDKKELELVNSNLIQYYSRYRVD